MLTESEVQYIKKLLKQRNHEYWNEKKTLEDLHRHCKYTIRKLTQQMANIDNYAVFKHLQEPTREHTLYLVYRSERLYSALADSEKLFKLISITIYDSVRFQEIIMNKSITKEDNQFVKRREVLFKRIMTQMNTFLETYKLFNNEFVFKQGPLKEYVMMQLEKVNQAKVQIEELRKSNPEVAALEDERQKKEEEAEAL